MIDTKLIASYLEAKEQRVRTERQLKEEKQREEDLAAAVHTMLANQGVGKVNVYGKTLYPIRRMYASSAGMPALIDALKESGHGALVTETVNATKLTSWVNEFDPDRLCSEQELRERLPEAVRDRIHLFEKITVGVTSS